MIGRTAVRRFQEAVAKVTFVCTCVHSLVLFLFTVLCSLGLRTSQGVLERVMDSLRDTSGLRTVRGVLGGLASGLATLWMIFALGI
ncbi:MAG: hypothetical protein LIP28_07675 [Deltaproteobacteria bacterium]|nr:hypothetical protein [Deltaproteobacteria bacterium]